MPCIPNTVAPWVGGKPRVLICGEPALLDNSKLSCMWAGMIEITNPGQTFVQDGGTSADSADSAGSEQIAGDLKITEGTPEEAELIETTKLTVADFVEILKAIEAKQGYEAARHYACNDINYWVINKLARRYIKAGREEDEELREKRLEKEEKNNPNLMPSKYMLLYGADDASLEREGNINDHPDLFDNGQEHKITVKKFREALRKMGYEDVAEDGPFDITLYSAYFRYLWKHGRVNIGGLYEYNDDEEHTFEDDADKYGVFSWKYFHDESEAGKNIEHEDIIEKLSGEYGDELLAEKGEDPRRYKPGVSYHYPWVPFSATIKSAVSQNMEVRYEIYDRNISVLVAKGEVVDGKIEGIFPDVDKPVIFINGERLKSETVLPPRPEIVGEDQIINVYWTYGENFTDLGKRDDVCISKYYDDLNLHIMTKPGNDGKTLKFVLENSDNQQFKLSGIVSDNKIVFETVFKKNILI